MLFKTKSGPLLSQYLNFDGFFFFFARVAQGHVTMTSSFQQNNSQKQGIHCTITIDM